MSTCSTECGGVCNIVCISANDVIEGSESIGGCVKRACVVFRDWGNGGHGRCQGIYHLGDILQLSFKDLRCRSSSSLKIGRCCCDSDGHDGQGENSSGKELHGGYQSKEEEQVVRAFEFENNVERPLGPSLYRPRKEFSSKSVNGTKSSYKGV